MTPALRHANLFDVESYYTVANTPLYLIEKLRADRTVQELARISDPTKTFSALVASLRKKPITSRDVVLPYVLAMMLFLQQDLASLNKARKLAAPHHKWFEYICSVLAELYQPTSLDSVVVQSQPKHKATTSRGTSTIALPGRAR